MTNARDEFIAHAMKSDMPHIKCALIKADDDYKEIDGKYQKVVGESFCLPVKYDNTQMAAFLTSLNFDYYAGYGSQELFGTIWYEDGTYSQRGEYDGSEWREHCTCPEIPAILQSSDTQMR